MDDDAYVRALEEALRMVGAFEEVAPGRFDVRIDPPGYGGGLVTVLVTPEEWAQVLAWSAGDDYDLYVSELVASRDADEVFLVFHDGDLVRSTREQLPPVHSRVYARYAAARPHRRRPSEPVGGWYAFPPDDER